MKMPPDSQIRIFLGDLGLDPEPDTRRMELRDALIELNAPLAEARALYDVVKIKAESLFKERRKRLRSALKALEARRMELLSDIGEVDLDDDDAVQAVDDAIGALADDITDYRENRVGPLLVEQAGNRAPATVYSVTLTQLVEGLVHRLGPAPYPDGLPDGRVEVTLIVTKGLEREIDVVRARMERLDPLDHLPTVVERWRAMQTSDDPLAPADFQIEFARAPHLLQTALERVAHAHGAEVMKSRRDVRKDRHRAVGMTILGGGLIAGGTVLTVATGGAAAPAGVLAGIGATKLLAGSLQALVRNAEANRVTHRNATANLHRIVKRLKEARKDQKTNVRVVEFADQALSNVLGVDFNLSLSSAISDFDSATTMLRNSERHVGHAIGNGRRRVAELDEQIATHREAMDDEALAAAEQARGEAQRALDEAQTKWVELQQLFDEGNTLAREAAEEFARWDSPTVQKWATVVGAIVGLAVGVATGGGVTSAMDPGAGNILQAIINIGKDAVYKDLEVLGFVLPNAVELTGTGTGLGADLLED